MTVIITLYADTFDEVKKCLQDELMRRAANLRTCGHNKTEKAKNERAAFELEQEAEWLNRTQFKPRAENPFGKDPQSSGPQDAPTEALGV